VLPVFSAIPGQAVPGRFTIAFPGTPAYTFWRYSGQVAEYYLDYLDVLLEETLYATPGGLYVIAVANTRAGLPVPPPGPQWSAGGEPAEMVLAEPAPRRKPADPAVIRARNAATARARAEIQRRMEMITRRKRGS
jgi:hypothetical protein